MCVCSEWMRTFFSLAEAGPVVEDLLCVAENELNHGLLHTYLLEGLVPATRRPVDIFTPSGGGGGVLIFFLLLFTNIA